MTDRSTWSLDADRWRGLVALLAVAVALASTLHGPREVAAAPAHPSAPAATPAAAPVDRSTPAAAAASTAVSARTPVGVGTVIDAVTEDGQSQQFRIDSVDLDPQDRDGDVRLYGVSVRTAQNTWIAYCAPDISGLAAAIPVQGSWSALGEFEPGAGKITFACTSGAIGKCIRFGYKPWKTHRGVALAPYHAACMRMVRADYCGDGRSHTVDGGRIDIWDQLGIQRREQRAGHPEVFEAAWGTRGAVYLHVPRWSDRASDVVRECPQRLAGRTSKGRPLPAARIARQFPEALIFNARFIRPEDRRAPAPTK